MNTRLRKVIFFILLVGITYIGYEYMIKPANNGLTDQKKRMSQKHERLTEFQKACAAAEDLNKQLEELKKGIETLQSKLPLTSEIHNVLEQVTIIAQKHGLETKDIKTVNREENNGYIDQRLKMKLEGNFNSFYSYMLELEQLSRIMKIRQLYIQKDLENEGNVTADFVISIFFQRQA